MPFAVGSNGDSIGQIIAERMRERLGRPMIIENIGGTDRSIGASRAARAKPDGYTIDTGFLGNHVLNGAFCSLNYDLLNGLRADLAADRGIGFSLCDKDSAGEGPARADCLVDVQSESVGCNRRGRAPLGHRRLSAGNWNTSSGRPLPLQSHRVPGPDGRPDSTSLSIHRTGCRWCGQAASKPLPRQATHV